ncbi:hypothetical protein [Actinomadura rugatobispora]|uniref:Antibiotic biosynthesis monooxygenase n=1 Tax=Actinomadura rugatobispora TaxID=1994 RepID=A0ABW1A2U0_9ACTN|nr:hypothetical protein GCM10010200_003420 [Actinomadura rugatobispora]
MTGPAGTTEQQHPDISRADAGAVLIDQWDVGTRERQRAGAAALARLWRSAPLPGGCLSRNLYVSDDGTAVLAYEQWRSHEAYRRFAETGRPPLTGEVAPGVERREPAAYRLYRTGLTARGRTPGSIVIIRFDTRDERAARALVDGLIEEFAGADLPGGGLASHFHIAVDGSRMLNYAEFTDAASHEAVIEASTRGGNRLGSLIARMDGVTPLGFRRYTLHTGVPGAPV